jgi:uncharacterized phosphosugar-binding protein
MQKVETGPISSAENLSYRNYFSKLLTILDRILEEQGASIERAATVIAECLKEDGIVHTFGTGHAHLIAAEPFYRAGGLAPVNAILDDRVTFSRGALDSTVAERTSGLAADILKSIAIDEKDVAIIISNSGRNAVPVEAAIAFKERGVKVIAITNLAHSKANSARNPTGKRLFEIADIVVDTCVPVGDAVISVPGIRFPIGPASTVAASAIVNAIFVQSSILLARKGITVPALPSGNLENISLEGVHQLLLSYRGRLSWLGSEEAAAKT